MIRKILKLSLLALIVGAVGMAVASRDEITRYRRINDMI